MMWLFAWVMALACVAPESNERVSVAEDTHSDAVDPLSWPIDQKGPFQVGYSSWEHIYVLSEALGERSIRIHMWYPTEDSTGSAGMYTVGSDPDVFADASPAPPVYAGEYPVHVHSHGDLHLGTGSAFLSRYLASHGWVSVGMDHTGNTLLDLNEEPSAANFFHRPLDVRAALDAVDASELVGGVADTSKTVLSGHSRGAYTTWASLGATFDLTSVEQMCSTGDHLDGDVCSADELSMFQVDLSDTRVVATIPLDGTIRREWFGAAGETSVRGPVLYFSPSESQGSQSQYEALGDIDFRWVTIDGACHQTFATGECPDLDRQEGFQIVNTMALAFARVTLLEDSSSDASAVLAGDWDNNTRVSVLER